MPIRFALATTVLLGAIARGAEPNDWAAVQALAGGTKVEVIAADLSRRAGRFAAATGAALSIETDQGPLTLPRSDVVRVSAKRGSRRKRVLLGAAVGAGAAAALAVVTYTATDIDVRRDLILGTVGAAGAAGGAGVGAALPSFRTVYRRDPP